VASYHTFVRIFSDRSSADVGCENDGDTNNVGEAGSLSSSLLKYSENTPLKDCSVGSQNFSRSGNRAHEKALTSKIDKVCRCIMECTDVMSGENNIRTTSGITGASTTTFITNNNNNNNNNNKAILGTSGTAVAQWLRCCSTNRKVDGSIPDGVIGIFH